MVDEVVEFFVVSYGSALSGVGCNELRTWCPIPDFVVVETEDAGSDFRVRYG